MVKVYARIDEQNNITAINSDIFLDDIEGWTEIDEGDGDKYAHAQNNYFEGGLVDDHGAYQYQYVAGKIIEKSKADTEEPVEETQQ